MGDNLEMQRHPGGRCRVLVIKDDRETAEQIVEFLAASGYEVDLAVDGDEGLSRARSADYAVMTIDRAPGHRWNSPNQTTMHRHQKNPPQLIGFMELVH